ncbi:centromere protein N [Periophthalmus magnuspinnatus]|uniref:centromere protein N n=1 Tax=Periophthalmus magnuspinnatus TaxID=409849 RepID=UPI00145B093B|nr:centromere protein N [Periophthalmus magnuspinnatus]
MDDIAQSLLKRLVRRIPRQMLQPTLEKWGRLQKAQLESMDFTLSKYALTEKLLSICEENDWSTKHITELELLYIIDNPNVGMWHAYQLLDPEDDAHTVELMQFKEQFKSHLTELIQNVSIKIKKHTDEAVWIRLAWGESFSQPNHFKPTYVVHYLQSPYVFMTSLKSKHRPLLDQALVLATRCQSIKDANLSGRKLIAIRDLLMKQYEQVFPSKFPRHIPENNENARNPLIEQEQSALSSNRLQMACEAFGGGKLPEIQSAVYRLKTKFRGHAKNMAQRKEPFKCVVKFSSTNLLESLRSCASSGIASTPVTPLLSSIPLKGRNYFVITDNGPGSSQTLHQQK